MKSDNLVIFRGALDGIQIILDKDAPFDLVKSAFINRLEKAEKFFRGADVNIHFKGRILTNKEKEELMEILAAQNILNVIFVHKFEDDKPQVIEEPTQSELEVPTQIQPKLEREDELVPKNTQAQSDMDLEKKEVKLVRGNDISPLIKKEKVGFISKTTNRIRQFGKGTPTIRKDLIRSSRTPIAAVVENNGKVGSTYFHYGMLRSGQELSYGGSVIVLGDVNPGAVVKADQNIIILGYLKGRAHAGLSQKNANAFIIAYGMRPVQIGIGVHIANTPEDERQEGAEHRPQIAYIVEEQIYVEEIDFKTLQNMIE
ncbi:MAG: hypothetical protein ATN36_06995 [Epulopiscium sp. Nele67-Bin005]|nr:MAG: hypothetical protein ATN36_06995 [Epulopiscium sp. Nele67-Bin005]